MYSYELPHFCCFYPFRDAETNFCRIFLSQMFSPLNYEENELSYMKIHQQIKKLVFLPYLPLLAGSRGGHSKGLNPKTNTYMHEMTLLLCFIIELSNSMYE